jgi:hypothetical protein
MHDPTQIWSHLAGRVLLPSHDFAAHLALADAVYRQWPAAALGRPPLWLPQPSDACRTNIARFLDRVRVRAICDTWGRGWDAWLHAAAPAFVVGLDSVLACVAP